MITGILIILIAILSHKAIKAFYAWLEYKYEALSVKKYKIDIGVDVSDDIEKRLDQIIESCFQEYTLTNVVYKTDWYITEPEEIQINKDICALVSERLSNTVYLQLKLYYNEDAIIDIIAKRVYFKVTNFVIEHNKGTGI